jgi:hypothetical protein
VAAEKHRVGRRKLCKGKWGAFVNSDPAGLVSSASVGVDELGSGPESPKDHANSPRKFSGRPEIAERYPEIAQPRGPESSARLLGISV